MLLPAIVAYLALFAAVGFLFVFASLLLGRFLRAHSPTPQKAAAYECGEPAVGPASVQFDLRFYVVALVFLIFEVEVAFFFPPAVVFGKANQLRGPAARRAAAETYEQLGVPRAAAPSPGEMEDAVVASQVRRQANALSLASMLDLGLFFAVLLVGFAFVWRRGDLNWVRAARHPATPQETAALVARLRRGDV